MDRWETRLANHDQDRLIHPFDWGLNWLDLPRNGDPGRQLGEFVAGAVAESDRFFSYRSPAGFEFENGSLRFPSAIVSPHPENNTVHAQYFPCPHAKARAVLVLPQWNADQQSHLGLCRLLNRFGLSALRMSLAYHDRRKPPETRRADYHVSSNLGRTIQATRQSVVDARSCLDWLESRGYRRLAILGTSLGSCVAFLTAAHDSRIRTGVFNHVSMYFSDVVWTGLSCRHIQETLHPSLEPDELRRYWSVISPATYLERLRGREMESLIIWGRYDTTFRPEYSRQVIETLRRVEARFEEVILPCGHYTSGRFPFNWLDGLAMCRFLKRRLPIN